MFKQLLLASLLCAFTSSLQAEIKLFIESPASDSTVTGVGLISGWAVSDSEIVTVEAFLDGNSLGQVPYGGSRGDVGSAFPDFPNSNLSGWAMKWNYGVSTPGSHTLEVVATTRDGEVKRAQREFSTAQFHLPFIPEDQILDLSNAELSHPAAGQIAVLDAELDGQLVDMLIQWDTGSQQFLLAEIEYPGTTTETNQAPVVQAGADREAETGDSVSVQGTASDSDGTVTRWQWRQVSGPSVSLSGSTSATVRFTAPQQAGDVRLELKVTDDDGATGSDRVTVTVSAPPAPSNQAPTASAGTDQTVIAGDAVTVQGSGSDSDGSITQWRWRQVSGPAISLSGTQTPVVDFTAPDQPGDIVLELTVTDNDGAQASDRVTIRVQAAASDVDSQTLSGMLTAINAARGQQQTCAGESQPRGPLPAMSWSAGLAGAAEAHSVDMATHGFFSHTSHDGTAMSDRLWPVWSGTRIAETIAGASNDRSNAEIVQMWLDSSSGHCQIIMSSNLTHVGVGKAWNPDLDETIKYYWTADFGG